MADAGKAPWSGFAEGCHSAFEIALPRVFLGLSPGLVKPSQGDSVVDHLTVLG